MPDVPPIAQERNLAPSTAPRPARSEPSPPCPLCGAASWCNGWRLVFPMVPSDTSGPPQRIERWLPRAKCSSCRLGFTAYPPDHYPHRQYQPDVVAGVVATACLGQASASETAKAHATSPSSVRRWTAWVAELIDPVQLWSLTARLDPYTPILPLPARLKEPGSLRFRAAQSLLALEALGQALGRSGVSLAARSGLGRLLQWQYSAHRLVCRLGTRLGDLSPAMVLAPSG